MTVRGRTKSFQSSLVTKPTSPALQWSMLLVLWVCGFAMLSTGLVSFATDLMQLLG